jgi:hypothetical protein
VTTDDWELEAALLVESGSTGILVYVGATRGHGHCTAVLVFSRSAIQATPIVLLLLRVGLYERGSISI